METLLPIGFEQLVLLVKQLPDAQWKKLKNEVENGPNTSISDLPEVGFPDTAFDKKELDNRIDHYLTNPDDLLEWEEVEKRLLVRNTK